MSRRFPEKEVEAVRETAYTPPERLQVFLTIMDDRAKGIDKLTAGRRKPGREQDLHDLMEQIASISEDLDDNLDDYNQRHKDVRKVLPKVVAATERWDTALKTPRMTRLTSLERTLALEAVADVRESAKKMIEEQKAYFLAHPPGKDAARDEHEKPRSSTPF